MAVNKRKSPKSGDLRKPSQIIRKHALANKYELQVDVYIPLYKLHRRYSERILSFFTSFNQTITFRHSYILKFKPGNIGANLSVVLVGDKKHLANIKPTLESWFLWPLVKVSTNWRK